MIPFFVNASNIDKLELKWSITESIPNVSDSYLTNNKIFFKNDTVLYSYDKDGNKSESMDYKEYFSVVQLDDDELILVFSNKLLLINEELKEVNSVYVTGTIEYFFVNDDSLLVFSSNLSKPNINIYFERFDANLELLNKDDFRLFGGFSVEKKNDVFVVCDYYGNELYIDYNYTFKPVTSLSDGSFLVHYDNYFYKYDKNKKMIASIDLEESGINQYKFKYYILNDKIYVSSISYVPKTTDSTSSDYGFNYYTIHLYLLNLDLKIVKENSISNSNKALKQYAPADYRYGFYLNNGNIYVYDGEALYNRYSKVSDDLSLVTVTSLEAVPINNSNSNMSDSYMISRSINDYLDDGTNLYSDFDYYKDDSGKYFVVAYLWRDINNRYEKKSVLFFLDKDYNVLTKKDFSDWDVDDKSLYPDYADNYPCFAKMYSAKIQEYLSDYLIVSWNTQKGSYIKIFDKKGNIIKDFSGDVSSIHMSPNILFVKDEAIVIVLIENFNFYCPAGISDYSSDEDLLGKQILYYDFPFYIYTKTDGNGDVQVSKSSQFSGQEIEFIVTPKEGYILEKVKVTDVNGNILVFTDYHFTMPSSDVLIEATFIKIPNNPNTFDIIILALSVISLILIFRRMFKDKLKWLS